MLICISLVLIRCICEAGYSGNSCNQCAAGFFGPSCRRCPACVHGKCNHETGYIAYNLLKVAEISNIYHNNKLTNNYV